MFLQSEDVFCICDKAVNLCSDIQVYSGDLCNCESYSCLKCLLCISAAFECVEISYEDVRVIRSGYCGEKWVCPEGNIGEQ